MPHKVSNPPLAQAPTTSDSPCTCARARAHMRAGVRMRPPFCSSPISCLPSLGRCGATGFQRVSVKQNLNLKGWNSQVHRGFPGSLGTHEAGYHEAMSPESWTLRCELSVGRHHARREAAAVPQGIPCWCRPGSHPPPAAFAHDGLSFWNPWSLSSSPIPSRARPISLLRLIIPTKIRSLTISGESPMDMRIPPLNIKILPESNPLKSRIFVRRLAVLSSILQNVSSTLK